MAYKSQVTNKYMGTAFKGTPRSNRNPASTELGQIVSALKNDLTPAVANWADANIVKMKDDATTKMQKLYASGKSSADINKEILAGKHKDLEHKYTEAVVEGQIGRIEAYETINKITTEIGNYKPREQTLESFWQGYTPNFDERGKFFTEGFAVVFNEYKAKALTHDAIERAKFNEDQKINGIVTSLKGEYKLNGYEEGKAWKLVESFGSPLPFSGKQNNYFVNNAAKNQAMFLFISDLVRTATTTEHLDNAEFLLEEARGGKHKLGSLADTYDAEAISKLYGSIISTRDDIKTRAWTKHTRDKVLKEENYINDYMDYLLGGTTSTGETVDRNGEHIEDGAPIKNADFYDKKADDLLNEMLDYNRELANSLISIRGNTNELDRDQDVLEGLFIEVGDGLYSEDLAGMTAKIDEAGGNMSDQTAFLAAWGNAKNRKENNLTLFPFLTDPYWQNSKATVKNIIETDKRLIVIEPDKAKRMIIANAVLHEYQKKVREWYNANPEPSKTLNNGNEWIKWNNEREQWKFATESKLISAYAKEDYYKQIKTLIDEGDTNEISKLIAGEATTQATSSIVEENVNATLTRLSDLNATIENIKQDSANALTPISELPIIKERVKAIKSELDKLGIKLDDADITKRFLEGLGIQDSDVNFEEVRATIESNIENIISEGFNKALPQLVSQKDKWWTVTVDESLLPTVESLAERAEFITNVMGELTGLGKEFAPNILLKLDPEIIDLMARSMNTDQDDFRKILETAFPSLKGKI